MAAWTLTYDGTTKSLADWGLSVDLVRERRSLGADVVTAPKPGAADAAELFAYGSAVVISRDGSPWFAGKVATPQRVARGGEEVVNYQFKGPWWDLERITFRQSWQTYNGDPDALVTHYASEVYLGQQADGTPQNTGAQITEALNWAIARGANLQIGTIDPAVNIPTQRVQGMMCSEVITMMLRASPDVIAWFDYATTPPTFHVRSLANLAAVSVTPPADQVRGLNLVPKHDLVVPSVLISFKRVHTVDGKAWVEITDQLYPPSATGMEIGASVHVIELTGMEGKNVTAEITTAPCNAQSGTEATRIAWWKVKNPLLADAKITDLHIESALIKDENGDTISLATHPNELMDGSLAAWMKNVDDSPVAGVQATIKALATYTLWFDDDHLINHKVNRTEVLTARVKLTNAVTKTYASLESLDPAEPIPTGLAQSLYTSCQQLQYEGTLELSGAEVPTGLGMGNKVNLVLPEATYSSLLVQGTHEDVSKGRLTLQLGPASHLGIADLIELLRFSRNRIRIVNPSARSTGLSDDQGSVDLGNKAPRENTVAGGGSEEAYAVSAAEDTGKRCVIMKDAAQRAFTMKIVDVATGTPTTGRAKLTLDFADMYGLEFKLREWEVCVDGDRKYALFLSSPAYATPVT